MATHEPQFTVICFDVLRDKRRRARLARELENAGLRVQRSVFEAWLTPAQRRLLQTRLARLLAPEDRLDMHVLRPLDVARMEVLSGSAPTENPAYRVI